jgi:multidrug efflux pump
LDSLWLWLIATVIVCGMLVGTLFTLFVLPTIYTVLARNHMRQTARSRQLADAEPALGPRTS